MIPTKTFTTLVVLILLLGSGSLAAAAGSPTATETPTPTATSAEANTTSTATPTVTPPATSTETSTATSTATSAATPTETTTPKSTTTCTAHLDQVRLHATDNTVSAGSPGEIAGGFQLAPGAECPVVVRITLTVPSGMTVAGASDGFSSGAGMVTSTFEVRPGTGVRDVRATVYSADTGSRTVVADVTYWPKGHEDQARELDSFAFTFDVTEPTTPSKDAGRSLTVPHLGEISASAGVVLALLGLLALAILRS